MKSIYWLISGWLNSGRFLQLLVMLLLAALLAACSTFRSQAELQVGQDLPAYLEAQVPVLMDRYSIPGISIGLIEGGRTTWVKSFGYADLEAGIRMTPETFARAQSISKSITAWGVMRLVESGDIKLTDPIVEHLHDWQTPTSVPPLGAITIEQLLSHQAGLALGTIGVHYPPTAQMPSLQENLAAEIDLIQPPGTAFSYSNVGFNLLELLIQEVTGGDFAGYMQAEVLIPLGMDSASFEWSQDWDPGVAVGYDLQGDRVPVYVYPEKGSGGLFVQLKDLTAFVEAEVLAYTPERPAVLSPESVRAMHSPKTPLTGQYALISDSYGYGHFIEELPTGQRAVWHGGQGHGWMTHYYAVPETGDGIVIVANSQRSWPFFAHVMGAWADWHGFGGIGIEIILQANRLLWLVIAVLVAIALLWAGKLVQGFRTGDRSLRWPLQPPSVGSLLGLVLAGPIVVAVFWLAGQEYSFLAVVFPLTHRWLYAALLLLALVLVAAALFPAKKGSAEAAKNLSRPS